MGLLDKLRGATKRGAKGVTVRIPANRQRTIYTYDGRPLAGMKAGDRFVARAVPADVEMTSIYTGATASCSEWGNVAYEYRGAVFGMGPASADEIRALMRDGYAVEVEAVVSGFDGQHGYPLVKGMYEK